ncbi:MarR family winged helix-turn-helix transcriptional regulator [Cohnella hongkongensis]|uniref:MarR family winged helix-turn-helix transcriptional regulator n=1 Tax=Cohnella hongkongensis TaxID=178337 RepID=A0ABV9FHQ0_9BACL
MQENEELQMIFQSFREVNQAFHQSMTQTTQRLGITAIQYFVMKIVAAHPGIGLNELADKIYSVTSTASGIVDRMVRAGWLSRERPPENRRSISLTLTPKGEAMWGKASELRQSQLIAAFSQLTSEDVQQLQRIHKKIVNMIQRQREVEKHESYE